MLHFSCDLCSCPLDDKRFVVRMEAYPAFDPEGLEEADLDLDHLQHIAEELQSEMTREPVASGELEEDNASKAFRFDLCPRCYRRFLRDPLGREMLRKLKFSKN